MANPQRQVFFISDSTGITTETFGHSLLSQFENIDFSIKALRYVNNHARAEAAVQQINRAAENTSARPLVFSTVIDPQLRHLVHQSHALVFDLFETYIPILQKELNASPSHASGRTHGVIDDLDYSSRMDAVNFAMRNDDGGSTRQYDRADVILIGVSRSGKTPACLYMALHYGVYAANYPLTTDDSLRDDLPSPLKAHRQKLFGLTIDPERLHRIRSQRQPGSEYASLPQCRTEVRHAESLFQTFQIPYLDTTSMSVEEIVTSIISQRKLNGTA